MQTERHRGFEPTDQNELAAYRYDPVGRHAVVCVGDADRVKGRHKAAEQRCGRQDHRQGVRWKNQSDGGGRGEQRTLRWRGTASNLRFRDALAPGPLALLEPPRRWRTSGVDPGASHRPSPAPRVPAAGDVEAVALVGPVDPGLD